MAARHEKNSIYKKLRFFLCATVYRSTVSGCRGTPYFRRYDWELVSKQAISSKKSWGGYRRTTNVLACLYRSIRPLILTQTDTFFLQRPQPLPLTLTLICSCGLFQFCYASGYSLCVGILFPGRVGSGRVWVNNPGNVLHRKNTLILFWLFR